MKQFRGGLVFKVHRLLYHSTLGSKVIKKKVMFSTRYLRSALSSYAFRIGVWCFGFRIWCLGCRVRGLRCRIWGVGFSVWGQECKVSGVVRRISGLGLELRVEGGFRI